MNDGSSTPTKRQQELFFAALELPGAAARGEFLALHCADDPALRRWLEEELRRQTTRLPAPVPETTLGGYGFEGSEHTPSSEAEALAQALKPEEAGDRIGPYRLIEPLGEGGFGVVWVAEQEQPVRRKVALKIIRLGMNSREVIARFAQERQALAVMDHPGIAKVFDAGATPFGRPYFAMELVRGVPITEFCDEYSLSLRLRLEMFRQVCSAVHHAHQKGIIHRDIKPNNVLVTLDEDGVATPKVIDFGIAKATEQQAPHRTDPRHAARPLAGHAAVHVARAGRDEDGRHRHAQRHLLARRPALRPRHRPHPARPRPARTPARSTR